MRIKLHFHINGFALSLALKQRLEVTQKWPTPLEHIIALICKMLKKFDTVRVTDYTAFFKLGVNIAYLIPFGIQRLQTTFYII